MNLLIRLIGVVVRACFRSRIAPLEESVLNLRVCPNDLDFNLHMNNGRFLAVMDLGRLDLLIRTGLAPTLLRHRWQPLAGAVNIRYKMSLLPFQRYRLRTRLLGWDEKWFYIEQRFERKNRTIAVALVKSLFRGDQRNLPPAEVLRHVNADLNTPDLPDQIKKWLSMDA